MTADRITRRFAALAEEGRAGLVTFVMAGDPDETTSRAVNRAILRAGADVIELGMPFSDPMADGPTIQRAGQRALKSGQTMTRTLALAAELRGADADVPIVLMGYFNPILAYGTARFLEDSRAAGVDGLIVVDLPPEEDAELCLPARAAGLSFIRLVAPTTDAKRMPGLMANAGGFVYYVAITGITGTRSAAGHAIERGVARIRAATSLPVAVGFGIKTPDQAGEAARVADAVAVGSEIVARVEAGLDAKGKPTQGLVDGVADFVAALAKGVRGARSAAA